MTWTVESMHTETCPVTQGAPHPLDSEIHTAGFSWVAERCVYLLLSQPEGSTKSREGRATSLKQVNGQNV